MAALLPFTYIGPMKTQHEMALRQRTASAVGVRHSVRRADEPSALNTHVGGTTHETHFVQWARQSDLLAALSTMLSHHNNANNRA